MSAANDESSREAATSTDVLDGGCHEHGNWNGDCCCNCRWHIEDFYHCATYKGPASQCVCSTHKGWICMPPDFGGAHSDWTEHGMCEMHEPKPSNVEIEGRAALSRVPLECSVRRDNHGKD